MLAYKHTKYEDRSLRYLPLFLISFATLFFEVLVIRWTASEIRIFGFFKNLILLATFLGLGLGCSAYGLADKQTVQAKAGAVKSWFPLLFTFLTLILYLAPSLGLTQMTFNFSQTSVDYMQNVTSIQALYLNTFAMAVIFLLVTSTFSSLGKVLGEELSKLAPLPAYTVNLLGSLAGVIVMSALSFFQTGPIVWLGAGFASLLFFFSRPFEILTFAACLVLGYFSAGNSIWSPYYRIDIRPSTYILKGNTRQELPYQLGTELLVNHGYHQRTIDLRKEFVDKHPELLNGSEYWTYNLPYVFKSNPGRVLVLGAGTGNDVAAALRHGATHVDAVEIDPVILSLGASVHPERPYADARVSAHVNDARNFVASAKDKYDLIAFGLVDSHAALSTLPSVRLDNYLYTKESLQSCTGILSPDGIAALSFSCGRPWLKDKLYRMVKSVTSDEPLLFGTGHDGSNSVLILWGPGLKAFRNAVPEPYKNWLIDAGQLSDTVAIPEDDWPFLYLKERQLSFFDFFVLGIVLSIATALTVSRFRFQPSLLARNSQFFLLGAAFLLLETRAMLAMAVLFGSTWIVNSVAIGVVLVMALLANLTVTRFKQLSETHGYIGLAASLLVLYFIPLNYFSGQEILTRTLATVFVLGAPFFFAGLVFSRAFSRSAAPQQALGMNILGAILGGCLEYLSMVTGAAALALLALGLYLTSWLAARFTKA